MIASLASLSADDRFDAKIQHDPKTETTTIRISIPKAAHSEPIQSVYLQRESNTGLDIHVPIMTKENPDDYLIYMVLPTSIAKDSSIKVTHHRTMTPNKDGTFTSTSGVQGGESYVISLAQKENVNSEAQK